MGSDAIGDPCFDCINIEARSEMYHRRFRDAREMLEKLNRQLPEEIGRDIYDERFDQE
jgi:hypothetical protein